MYKNDKPYVAKKTKKQKQTMNTDEYTERLTNDEPSHINIQYFQRIILRKILLTSKKLNRTAKSLAS